MNLFSNDHDSLFFSLFKAKNESEVESIVSASPILSDNSNWRPLGGNESNYGVIENQQSSPIAALIEKVTNSIDATLMKKCLEAGINPKSPEAPKSIAQAVERLFPDANTWDIASYRRNQAKDIQIVADGSPRDTSVIIYDNGEGQRPEEFENTFLSLLRGNKNEIKFVQGKYNMGGSGAIVFCGKRGYQLIASKRFDGGDFGFTLIREHPLSKIERETKKNTWYEYLVIDGVIPSFPIDKLELNLFERKFQTGSIIKLYSYQFPSGYSGFAQDLNQSLNEYLFEPALPIYTVDKKERYPKNKVLERDLFGLKRRLEEDGSSGKSYVETYFSETYEDEALGNGKVHVTCYVFKSKIEEWDYKKTREEIQKRFFKNGMAVMFSLNGQVHGHYTYEFISRSLKMNLLKHHLLIHVDCTEIDYEIRKELFMASRDRLKQGEETTKLRKFLATKLQKSQLAEINKRRKQGISSDAGDSKELIKSLAKDLTFNNDLMKLLGQTFQLDQATTGKKQHPKPTQHPKKKEKAPFRPERFPTFLKFKGKEAGKDEIHAVGIPLNGERVIKLETDVEDHYFDRVEEPGDLEISLLGFNEDGSSGGTAPGNKVDTVQDIFNVVKSSPSEGTIKVHLHPRKEVAVGDAAKIKISLTGPGEELEHVFMVSIKDPEKKADKPKKELQKSESPLALPELTLVYREAEEDGVTTWKQASEASSFDFDYSVVMYPVAEGDEIERVFINMDSRVLMDYKSKIKSPSSEQLELTNRKYISSVYFHTLFLYSITRNRSYQIYQEPEEGDKQHVDIGDYLKDVFASYYSEFLLNFGGMEEVMLGLGG